MYLQPNLTASVSTDTQGKRAPILRQGPSGNYNFGNRRIALSVTYITTLVIPNTTLTKVGNEGSDDIKNEVSAFPVRFYYII